MMFNIGRLFHINKKNKYLFMNDLEVITLLCGLKNVTCPNPGYTSITWVDIEFISEKNQTVAVQRAAQTNSCNLNTL